jgi:uncharacterized membrane-anchored protein
METILGATLVTTLVTILLKITLGLISSIGIAGFITSKHDIAVFFRERILCAGLIYLINNARRETTARIFLNIYYFVKKMTSCEYCTSFWSSLVVLYLIGVGWFLIPAALFNAVVSGYLCENIFNKRITQPNIPTNIPTNT